MSGPLKKIEDRDLIMRIQLHNDQLAYAALLNKYNKSLYFTILKMVNNRDDAEDITMQAFSKAFSNLDAYDHRFAFTTWLFKIGTNAAIDFIRKKRIDTTSLDKPMDDSSESGTSFSQFIVDNQPDPEEEMILSQRSSMLQELIEQLPHKYKELLQLRYYEELKYEEIAERLALPVGTVKVRLSRAKALLGEIISGNQNF
jgi:RNA polymerase sigma factor (sigma-70 family)